MKYESTADWRDPNWKYVPAAATDVARTFARIRRELKALDDKQKENKHETIDSVRERCA